MLGGLVPLPAGDIPELGAWSPPVRGAVTWIAAHVFGVHRALVFTGSGSGDKTFDWVLAFCILVTAAIAAGAWSVADARCEYDALNRWFRLVLRFALGSTLVFYGSVKVIPLQMPAPGLARLLEPFGSFSPMGVLWASIGASPAYEMFTGAAEMTAGILLFIPALATLGALFALADVVEVFVLNMTYDVPVKLFSFHLVLMSLVLLAPDARRLARTAVGRRRTARSLAIAQLVFGAYIVAMALYAGAGRWKQYGAGAPKSALYGIWNVDEMTTDGKARPPLLTDAGRWRRVLFQTPTAASFQRMDDTLATYPASIDIASGRIVLRKASDKSLAASLAYAQPERGRLVLSGDMDGHRVDMRLRLVGPQTFVLVSRGFHWIQEYPFNR